MSHQVALTRVLQPFLDQVFPDLLHQASVIYLPDLYYQHSLIHFIDETTFADLVAQNKFLEHASVFDYNYGTSKQWVEEKLKQNIDIILEIDWQGAQDIRKLIPESISIFILPPSFAALKQRLNSRGDDDGETIQRRMQGALNELSHYREFDYLVVNDDLESALEGLRTIIESIRQNNPYQAPDNRAFAEQIMAQGAEVQ